ncbi:MAG: anthranilate synthase component I family protein [Pseudomonadota bacterium]
MIIDAVFGEGFCGALSRLSAPRCIWTVLQNDLGSTDVFALLREAENSLSSDEILAGYIGYECAAAQMPRLKFLAPPINAPAACFAIFQQRQPFPLGAIEDRHVPELSSIDHGHTCAEYCAKVDHIRDRIAAGDFFQVNLSHRQSAFYAPGKERLIDTLPLDPALSARFGAMLDMGVYSILSASPELFLSLDGTILASEPIKGTRPRVSDPDADQQLLRELENDLKDRAENIMIVDLIRNDFAKVCTDGSITEPVLCASRSYPAVHHLYSRIEGQLQPGRGFADALEAAFPCGSITGAPKQAAMDAIAELEGEGRGAYCGTVFTCTRVQSRASVAIRTAMIDEDTRRVDVRSGGGVTLLSNPEAEYDETLDKAYLFRALTDTHDYYRR